jgi:beta-lactamase class A
MTPLLTRRDVAAGIGALTISPAILPVAAAGNPIAGIEHRHGRRLGVFALDTGSGRSLAYRADEHFVLCSSFKALLAAQVLARVDAGEESLGRMIAYGEKDMMFTSPVTKAHLRDGALPVKTLCQAIVEVSDNTAAILLMRSVGGPAAITRFIRSLGDTVTRLDRYEPDLNLYSGELDTTTPRAILVSARAILLGDALKPASRAMLEGWMIASTTGSKRLRAAFPPDWIAGDKTGTSAVEESNDFAIVRPPGRAPLLVSAYYDAPKLNLDAREAVLREVGAVFVVWAKA